MSREQYAPRETYSGSGILDEYTFDFKIEAASQLLVRIYDENGVENESFRGDGTIEGNPAVNADWFGSLEYDSVEGGGTLTLSDELTTDYTIVLLQANDEPTQAFEFKQKFDLTVNRFERALDWIAGAIQRAIYLSKRSIVLDDYDDISNFDLRLPPGLADYPNHVISTNENDDGDADALELREISDLTGMAASVEHSVSDGQAATALSGETLAPSNYTSYLYWYEIIRGTSVFSTGYFGLHYRDSSWRVVMGQDIRDDDSSAHGVTFSVTSNQLYAALDSGAGDGTIKLKNHKFTA
jgi:hypothetical protein